MGLLKSFKDLKNMAAEAPAMVGQANQLAASAQAVADAQHQAALAAAPAQQHVGDVWAPIGGVSLELYTEISKSFASVGYDQSKGAELAAAKGVGAADWQEAMDGWNARMRLHPAVAQRFNALYTGR